MADTSLQTLNLNFPIGSIDAYIYRANQIPLLTFDQEQELATRLQQNGDINAARELVLAHLRYVVRISKSYMGYGLSLNDLIQEGNIGLMKAVKRFNPKIGVRLVTFAGHWIKAEIHEFILKNWRIVKIATTKAQRKLFFNLRSMKKHLNWFSEAEIQDVAKDLKVKPETVREMEMRLSMHDTAFDPSTDEDDDTAAFAPAGYLEDHRYNPATQFEKTHSDKQSNSALHKALDILDERSLDIINARWLDQNSKLTLQDLADKYKVSAERIRQLENNAMKKLKAAMEEA